MELFSWPVQIIKKQTNKQKSSFKNLVFKKETGKQKQRQTETVGNRNRRISNSIVRPNWGTFNNL